MPKGLCQFSGRVTVYNWHSINAAVSVDMSAWRGSSPGSRPPFLGTPARGQRGGGLSVQAAFRAVPGVPSASSAPPAQAQGKPPGLELPKGRLHSWDSFLAGGLAGG